MPVLSPWLAVTEFDIDELHAHGARISAFENKVSAHMSPWINSLTLFFSSLDVLDENTNGTSTEGA
jgi:hypothetical protein